MIPIRISSKLNHDTKIMTIIKYYENNKKEIKHLHLSKDYKEVINITYNETL